MQHNRVWSKPKIEADYDTYIETFTKPIKHTGIWGYQRINERQRQYQIQHSLEPGTKPEMQFMNLCRGNLAQTPAMQTKLKCFIERKRHPYLYINPVKTEHLSESPPIYQFYDIIGNNTIETLKRLHSPLVKPSRFAGLNNIKKLTKMRTSVGTELQSGRIPKSVYNLAEMVSGLKIINSSESSQYAEYKYGRFHNYHKDNVRIFNKVIMSQQLIFYSNFS